MSCHFDYEIIREGTRSLKYDGRQSVFGRSDVVPLWVADMDFAVPPAVSRALVERANHPIYGYTLFPDSLYESLQDWLQLRHNWTVRRDWIVMCPGVVPSLNAAVMAYTQPGDSVIIQPPVYFPFFSAVTQTGRKLIENPLRLNNDRYTIDFEHLEQCAKSARLLLFCSPHNPVGRVWEKQELEQLLQIARKYDLIIFSDEIHSDLVFSGNKHRALATFTEYDVAVVSAVAPSKTFNIPGLNLSALVIPDKKNRQAIIKVFDTMRISASNPFSIVAFETAYREGEAWLQELLVYLGDTRDSTEAYISSYLPEIQLIKSEGTYLLWLDCRAWQMTDTQLKHFFVHEVGIGLSPGALFGQEGSGFMRLNIGAPSNKILAALERIRAIRRNAI